MLSQPGAWADDVPTPTVAADDSTTVADTADAADVIADGATTEQDAASPDADDASTSAFRVDGDPVDAGGPSSNSVAKAHKPAVTIQQPQKQKGPQKKPPPQQQQHFGKLGKPGPPYKGNQKNYQPPQQPRNLPQSASPSRVCMLMCVGVHGIEDGVSSPYYMLPINHVL